MSFEESPSLGMYKNGLPPKLPDPSRRRRMVWALIFGLAILSLGLAYINMAQNGVLSVLTGTGGITGVVYDEKGNPIVAEVFLFGANFSSFSDETGHFVIEGVPAGQQIVVVAYRNIGREYVVDVIAGKTVHMGVVRFQPEDFNNGWSQGSEEASQN